MSQRERVSFVEVGPRDGFQNWPEPVGTDVKLRLIRAALDAGMARVEATSMVSPKWVPQMADAAEVMAGIAASEMPRIRVLVPNLKGFERAVEAGARNVLVNIAVTEGFNQHNLNRSIAETLTDISEVVTAAVRADVRVDASLSVAWGCPYDGPVSADQVMAVADQVAELGVAELSFGDTIGVSAPTGVIEVATRALERYPGLDISMHFHDTRGMALANVFAALECGVRGFEGSIGGIGGCPFAPNSTGNVCSEDLLAMIDDLDYETGVDVDRLIDAARDMAEALHAELPGRLHRAGRAPWLTRVEA